MRFIYKLLRFIKRTDPIIFIEDKDPSFWDNNRHYLVSFLKVCASIIILGFVIYQLPTNF